MRLFVFGAASIFFGWVVAMWLTAPWWIRPRIVPYVTRELGTVRRRDDGRVPARARALSRDRRSRPDGAGARGDAALRLRVRLRPLRQVVRWHPASDGLRTVEALRRGGAAEPDAAHDLEALATVLRVAAEQGVDFSLVLRLYAKESMQAVCTREVRRGSFW